MPDTHFIMISFLSLIRHTFLNISLQPDKEHLITFGGIIATTSGLTLTALIMVIIIKWRMSRLTDEFKKTGDPVVPKKLQREYRHYTRLYPSSRGVSDDINISPALQQYIDGYNRHVCDSRIYLLHQYDTKMKCPKAQALIELLKYRGTVYAILIKRASSPLLRVPERFIYYKIFREFGRNIEKIVFIFRKESSRTHYQEQFDNLLSHKAGLALPGFTLKKITSNDRSRFKTDLKKCGLWQRIKAVQDTRLAFQGPYFALYETEKLSVRSGIKYWFRALNFSALYRTGEGFWLFYAYFSQMLLGIFFAAIVTYAGQIMIAGFVVISIFYFITYVLERYILPLIRLKIAEEVNRDIVFLRRDDTRVSREDHGSLWQKRVQNYDANNNLVRFFRYFAVLNIIMIFLFLLLIPEKTFLHPSLLKFIPQFSPLQYLLFFLLWWVMDNAVSIYGELYWKELATAEIITGEEAVRKGLSKFSNIVEGVFVVSTAGFLLGFGISTLHIESLMTLLLIVGSTVSIASGFILPLAMPAFKYYLVLHTENFFDTGKDNEILLSHGLKIMFNPVNPRLRHTVPIDWIDGKTWLPAAEELNPVLVYPKKPTVTLKNGRILISAGNNVPLITFNKTRGFFINPGCINVEKSPGADGNEHFLVSFKSRPKT